MMTAAERRRPCLNQEYDNENPVKACTVRGGKQYNPYLVDTQPGDSAEQEHIRQVRYLTMVRM
jgi:hypothetical protein